MGRDEYLREIGAKLRGKRAYAGLSQKAVEAETGIDTSELSRVENGDKAPRFDELLMLLGLYDMTLAELLEGIVPLVDPPSATRASSKPESQPQPA